MSDEPEEFHPYVRLLLARMKSNPDDFTYEANLVPLNTEMFFTEAEKAAVWAARREVVLSRSHEQLMQRILKSNEPDEYETTDGKYRATERYANSPTAGQVLATSQNGYTWTTTDHDAYLAQKQAAQRQHAALMNAQQSSLMQNQLGGLAQSQQGRLYNDPNLYSGATTMPATTASALGLKTETASEALTGVTSTTVTAELIKSLNKLLGR